LRLQAGLEVRKQRRRGDQFTRARDQVLGSDHVFARDASVDRLGQLVAEQPIQDAAVDLGAGVEQLDAGGRVDRLRHDQRPLVAARRDRLQVLRIIIRFDWRRGSWPVHHLSFERRAKRQL